MCDVFKSLTQLSIESRVANEERGASDVISKQFLVCSDKPAAKAGQFNVSDRPGGSYQALLTDSVDSSPDETLDDRSGTV